MTTTTNDFRNELVRMLAKAQTFGFIAVDINAGQIHRRVGDYPGKGHRMPACCAAMLSTMTPDDEIVVQPPSGRGARLTIRYRLPRPPAK